MTKNGLIVKSIISLILATTIFTCNSLFAQSGKTIEVKGSVTDVEGNAVIGASVTVEGTFNGTATDAAGEFKISAPSDGTLTVEYLGMEAQKVEVANRTFIEIVLQNSGVEIDEVIAVGYATGSRHTISGAVQKISKEELNSGFNANPLSSLKGKVAGVVIQKSGGDPTTTPSVRVRGTTSLSGGNDPLVIIDGVFGDLSLLNALAPSDIESYTILKDASETAQYGSRGASGVIVVTTTKGGAGSTNLNYEGSFGVEQVYKNIEMLSADEYRAAVSQYKIATALDAGDATNFIDQMERLGSIQNHKISFGSGSRNSSYRASLGVIDQQGIIKSSGMRNYTAKFDAMQSMFDNKLVLEMGMFASMKENDYVNDLQKTFYSAAAFNPTFPSAQKADGTWYEDPNANEVDNPLGRLTIDDQEQNAYANIHAKLAWNIADGLKLSAFGSYTYNNKVNSVYIPLNIKQGIRESDGRASKNLNLSEVIMGNVTLSYKKDFDQHHIDALLLGEVQQYTYAGFGATARKFGTNYFGYNNLAAGALVKYGDVSSYNNGYQLASFMGRFNYVYAGKYIATVNFRADGSSKLGANNKWGMFPSGSFAWVASREEFLKDVSWLDELKVRVGYGVTGNQDAISSYNSLEMMVPQGITTVDGSQVVTYGVARNANPDLRWEEKKMFDTGIDLAILDNKLTMSLDYYHSVTEGLLYNYKVPVPPFIYPSLLANLGSMKNDGVELGVGYQVFNRKNQSLHLSFNVTYQTNELLSLSGTYMGEDLSAAKYMSLGGINGAGFIGGNNQAVYQIVGQPVGVFYLPKTDGLIDQGKSGLKYNIVDLDEDGKVDLNDGKDRYVAGQAVPKVFLGANLNYRFYGLDVQMQLNGAFGHKIYNGTSLTYMNMTQFPTYNVLKEAPALNIRDSRVTDYWLEDGDYVHIEYVTVGYNFNVDKARYCRSMRIYFSVNNLYTFTGYSGLSPLINSTVVGSNLGIDDKRFYPMSRTYSLGLSLNF